eukprot:5702613-Prymnesium_polylepis.1
MAAAARRDGGRGGALLRGHVGYGAAGTAHPNMGPATLTWTDTYLAHTTTYTAREAMSAMAHGTLLRHETPSSPSQYGTSHPNSIAHATSIMSAVWRARCRHAPP